MASELILSRAPWILNKDGTFVTTPPDTPITPPSSVTMPSTSVFAEEGQESEKVESHSAVPSGALANESVVYPEPVQCLSLTPPSAISAQFEEEVVRQPGYVHSLNIQPLTTYEPLQFTKSDVNQVSWAEHFRYGFPIKEDEQWVKSEAVWWAKYRLQISTWEARWINALNAYNSGRLERISALRTGVPATLRSRVWCALSGIAQRASESEGFVKMTLDLEHVILSSNVPRSNDVPGNGSSVAVAAIQEHFDAIEKDVYRTFTEHPYFQVPGEGHLIVRDVLRALVWRNPLVGYCQSYNYIASVLVVVHRNVDLVFWSMCHLVEHVLPTDYFAASLHGTVVDQEVILDLIVDHCPKVHTHFATHGIDIRPLLPGWTMTLFVNVFPLETTLRIWDTLFLDSDASTTPLRVVLAMIRLHHDLIVACDDAASVMITLNECASSFFDVDRLLNSVATIKLTPIQLTALRQQVRQRMRGGSALTTEMEFCSSMNSPENMSAFSASSSAGSMNLNADPEGSKRRGRTASISLSSFTACIMAKPAQIKEGSSRFWNALVNSFPNDNTTSRSLNSVVEEENS